MRLIRSILISFLLGLGVVSSYARPIGEETARQSAQRFFSLHPYSLRSSWSAPTDNYELQLVSALPVGERSTKSKGVNLSATETYSYYIYNRGDNNGFVMVAGDDVLPEVLAYALTGSFSWEGMPEHIASFMAGYKRALDRYIITQKNPQKMNAKRAITPILHNISWGQGEPWNDKCPRKYPVGCVATAISQIMRFYQWPDKGVGSYTHSENGRTHRVNFETSYDWKNMPGILPIKPDTYYESYEYTPEQKEALSTFCYHVGVASNMIYGADGSGTRSAYVVRALRENFRYDRSTVRLVTRNTTTQEEWNNLIYNELSHNRPVYYAGAGSGGGHAFICDGYDGDGRFHINWGWNGMSDNYFNLNILDPDALGTGGGAGGGFSEEQEAIIGIIPDRGNKPKLDTQPTIEQHRWALSSYSSKIKVNYAYLFLASEPSFSTKFRLVVESVEGGTPIRSAAGRQVTLLHSAYKKELSSYIPYIHFTELGDYKNKRYRVYVEYQFRDTWVRVSHVQGFPSELYIRFDGDGHCTRETIEFNKNLQFVEGSTIAHLNAMAKSSFSFVVRNVGVEEYHHLSLREAKTGRKLATLVEPIPVGKETRLTFAIDKLPFKTGTEVQLELQSDDNTMDPRLALGTYKVGSADNVALALGYDGDVNEMNQIEISLDNPKLPELIFRNTSTNTLIEKGFAYCVVLMATVNGQTVQYLTDWNRVEKDILAGKTLRLTPAWKWKESVPQPGVYRVELVVVDRTLKAPISIAETKIPSIAVKEGNAPVIEEYSITTSREGQGHLSVNGKSTLEHLALGAKVEVKATPAAGWKLRSLVAECAGKTEAIANGATLVVKGNTHIKAVFEQGVGSSYSLRVLNSKPVGAGSLIVRDRKDRHILSPEELQSIAPNTRLLLYPQAARENYRVQKILVDGKEVRLLRESIYQGGATYAVITITKDTEVQVLFLSQKVQVKVQKKWDKKGGMLQFNSCDASSPMDTFEKGTKVRIKATPFAGYQLTSLKVGGEEILDKEHCFVAKGDLCVEATFMKEEVRAIAEYEGASGVKVYPNPAVDRVQIEDAHVGAMVYLFDLSGICVATSRVASSGIAVLDLFTVPAGDYILSVAGKVVKLVVTK